MPIRTVGTARISMPLWAGGFSRIMKKIPLGTHLKSGVNRHGKTLHGM
jgi:hypothetical protein